MKVAAYKPGAASTEIWSATLDLGATAAEDIAITFDGNDTMFIGGGALYAVDTRTGGCRWQFVPDGVGGHAAADMLGAPTAAGGGFCFTLVNGMGNDKVVALAVESAPGQGMSA